MKKHGQKYAALRGCPAAHKDTETARVDDELRELGRVLDRAGALADALATHERRASKSGRQKRITD